MRQGMIQAQGAIYSGERRPWLIPHTFSSVSAGTETQTTIQVGSRPFVLVGFGVRLPVDAGGNLVPFNMEIRDTQGDPLQPDPFDLAAIVSTDYRQPFYLPIPYLFNAQSGIELTVQNTDAADAGTLYVVLIGWREARLP